MKSMTMPNRSIERDVAVFRSINEANRWLRHRRSIVILNLRVEHLSAPRTRLHRIIIDYVSYPYSVNITYGIDKTIYLSRRRATELALHSDQWSMKKPHKEFVLCDRSTTMHYRYADGKLKHGLIRSTFITLYKTEKTNLQ